MPPDHLWTILLAGGDGFRLRELTRLASGAVVPKQYCSLVGPTSLLRLALARALRLVPAERVVAVVSAQHRHWWRRDLPELDRDNILVQPANRGTAPAILLATREIWRRDRDATVLVMPSDHYVEQEWALAVSLIGAAELARRRPNRIVVVGVEPETIDEGYGWILPAHNRRRKHAVAEFVEKPGVAACQDLAKQGAVIHTFLLAARAATLVEQFDELLPDVAELFRRFAAFRPGRLAALYRELRRIDFSHDLLERSVQKIELVIAPPCGWTDLGTPARVGAFVERRAPARKVFGRTPEAPLQLANALDHAPPALV